MINCLHFCFIFAFKFILRCYTKATAQLATEQLAPDQIGATAEAGWDRLHADPALFMGQLNGGGASGAGKAGWCKSTPGRSHVDNRLTPASLELHPSFTPASPQLQPASPQLDHA
jgi:hypothetical protein